MKRKLPLYGNWFSSNSKRRSAPSILPTTYTSGISTAQSSTSTLTTLTKTSPHLHVQQPTRMQRNFKMISHPPPPPEMSHVPPLATPKALNGAPVPGLRAMCSMSSLRSWCSMSSISSTSSGPPPEPPPKSVLRPSPGHINYLRQPSCERPASTQPSIRWSSAPSSISSRRASGPCPLAPLPQLPEEAIPPVPPVPRLPSPSQFDQETDKEVKPPSLRVRSRPLRTSSRDRDLYRSALVRRASFSSNVSFAPPPAWSHGRSDSAHSKSSLPPRSILKKSTSDASFKTARTARTADQRVRRQPSNLSISSNLDELDEIPELELIGIKNGAYIVNVREPRRSALTEALQKSEHDNARAMAHSEMTLNRQMMQPVSGLGLTV